MIIASKLDKSHCSRYATFSFLEMSDVDPCPAEPEYALLLHTV